jgi:hypothetical protein
VRPVEADLVQRIEADVHAPVKSCGNIRRHPIT